MKIISSKTLATELITEMHKEKKPGKRNDIDENEAAGKTRKF